MSGRSLWRERAAAVGAEDVFFAEAERWTISYDAVVLTPDRPVLVVRSRYGKAIRAGGLTPSKNALIYHDPCHQKKPLGVADKLRAPIQAHEARAFCNLRNADGRRGCEGKSISHLMTARAPSASVTCGSSML